MSRTLPKGNRVMGGRWKDWRTTDRPRDFVEIPLPKALHRRCRSCSSNGFPVRMRVLKRDLEDGLTWVCPMCDFRIPILIEEIESWRKPEALRPPATAKKPRCKRCGGPTALRPGKFGAFWGCVKYYACRGVPIKP